ncbi:MAG: hypothetical protein ACRBF0_17815 [Calditrichia bacterium]
MIRFLAILFVIQLGSLSANPVVSPVNVVLGDASFLATFGMLPDAETDEQLRIETHLAYVEDLLRSKNVEHLSAELRNRRFQLLDMLRDYRLAGEFPRNYDYTERTPCFIDRDGNICAVGYLVEQTAGKELAEQINSLYQYANIYDMDSPELSEWVAQSGLTLEECAMIQPTYFPLEEEEVKTSLAVSTGLLTGINVSIMTLDIIQLSGNADSKRAAVVGLFFGSAQFLLGLASYPEKQDNSLHKSQKNFARANLGFASGTLLLSAWNLIANRKYRKKKPLAWNVYSYSSESKQPGLGFSLIRHF